MGFGNIGIGELMVILLVVMVIFGPKRLPEIARNMGKFMRDFRRETNAAITELKQGIEPVRVGIFDEPDGGAAAATPNGGTAPMPGVAAAGGAGTVPAERPVAYQSAGNGAGRTQAKPKPRTKKAAATTATSKRKAATPAKKRPASKAKRPAARSGGTRKR